MQEAIRHGSRAGSRPTRTELEPAARALVERHSGQLIATARRYSLSAEDAEDAYQRGLEIMLTRAPSSLSEDELVPWLKTVVKHEAFTIRKQRQHAELAVDGDYANGHVPPAHEQAERLERLRLGVEAMSRLKPQEIRCLLLRAEGYSYRQICDETGWTYTKVNRCISEGRRSFLARVAGIESGAECERMQPLLSRLVDGEATADDMAAMRPHLRSCLACRATLREFRATPARVAAFAPLLVTPGLVQRVLKALGLQKTAAAVAVVASVAGAGVAVVQHGSGHAHKPPPPPAHHRPHAHPKPKTHPRPKAHIAHAHKAHKKQHHTKPVTHTTTPPPATPPPATPRAAPPPATPTSGEFGP
jgi:RNA polymerase sigma factor (sigma-70 family)